MNAQSPISDITARFVVLLHQPGPGLTRGVDAAQAVADVHLDWMFEFDGCLKTWASCVVNDLHDTFETMAMQLPDHRIEYLQFEGDLSRDRGNVQRVLSGTLQTLEFSRERLLAELSCEGSCEISTRRLEIQRNCNSFSFNDETRDAWALRLELCR